MDDGACRGDAGRVVSSFADVDAEVGLVVNCGHLFITHGYGRGDHVVHGPTSELQSPANWDVLQLAVRVNQYRPR